MTRSNADLTMSNEEKTRMTYKAAVRGAWIAGVFCVLVLGLLAGNHRALQSADPQKSPQLKTLQTQLEKQPKNAALKTQIRNLDLQLRREYLGRLAFANQGGYVLLLGVAMFLITSVTAGQCKKKITLPSAARQGSDDLRQSATTDRRSVAVLGAVAVMGLMMLAVLSRGDLNEEFLKASRNYHEPLASVGSDNTAVAAAPPAQPAALSATPTTPAPAPPASAPVVLGSGTMPPLNPLAAGLAVKPSAPKQAKPAATTAAKPKPKPAGITTVAFDANDYSHSAEEWAANWPVFRGSAGNGFVESGEYLPNWNGASGEGVLWKTEISLPGWSSPVVWGDKVFLSGGNKKSREVYCLDAASGMIIWQQPIDMISKQTDVMEDTGYAPSTVAVDGKRVFAIFPNGDLVCLDFDGKKLWTKAFGVPESAYGYATSLAMHKSLLIVVFDQGSETEGSKSKIYALQAGTGDVVWYAKRPVCNSWPTPIVYNTGDRLELITSANPLVISYDPMTGEEFWRADLMSGDVAPSPTFGGGYVYACNTGAVLAAIKPGGKGDITKKQVAWQFSDNLPDISSPACDGQFVYMAGSDGTVTTVDCKSGKMVWSHTFGAGFQASPIVVGKRVYALDTDGIMHIIAADKTFKEEHKCTLGEKANATPAFVGNKIYIRGEKRLYCIGAR